MKVFKSIESAQHDEYGVTVVDAEADDRVRYSNIYGAWEITITQEGLDCDCGKGVLCPLHTSRKTHINILSF